MQSLTGFREDQSDLKMCDVIMIPTSSNHIKISRLQDFISPYYKNYNPAKTGHIIQVLENNMELTANAVEAYLVGDQLNKNKK